MSDVSVFSSPNFDSNEYANAILAGETHPPLLDSKSAGKVVTARPTTQDPPAKEDISVAISKLTFGIDDVSKQIKNMVTTHHEDLLSQAASANNLSGSLTSVREGLSGLDSSLEKLRLKIRVPYQSLQKNVTRLQKLQQASDVLRRTSRFVGLTRRLQVQMTDMDGGDTTGDKKGKMRANGATDSHGLLGQGHDLEDEKERTIAKAALSIAELAALLDGPGEQPSIPLQEYRLSDGTNNTESTTLSNDIDNSGTRISLRSIETVAAHVPFIEYARAKVTSEMESMVLTGLTTLNQSLLASSLQTAYNLRVLPELVQNLILDLSQAVEERIRSAFDLSKISKDALSKASSSTQSNPVYRSRVRTEPTSVTAPQFTAALWSRLEGMVGEMADCCVKVYVLEKVLKMKKDTTTQVVFLDEAMKLLENKPSATFWTSLGRSLEKHARDSAKSSAFLQQTLSTRYPKLLRLFHEFFAKIAVHTDTMYSPTHQSPETILVLRGLANFESLYLSRSSNKLNESVAQAFSGGGRAPPGLNEAINISRSITNELDSARFDPLLVKSVAKNAISSLDMMLSRADSLASAYLSLWEVGVGPAATPQQISNGQIATCLYQCWLRLEKLAGEHSDAAYGILKPTIQKICQAYEHLVEPVMAAVRRELGAIIARLHRIDFSKAVDPMAGMGGPSFYMNDLVEKLSFIKSQVLSNFSIGDAGRTWVMSIVKFVIRTFVLHMSIARPLGESGKLQLTSDMTELEFALSAFLVENPQSKRGGNLEVIGDDYRVLRAMRPLLFLENAQLAVPKQTAGLPPLIVLHHILVRSPVPLPHSLHGWQEAEYVRWVDEHSDAEAWTLVEGGLSHWEKISESEGENGGAASEYIELARAVLRNSQMA
ncbi:Golgi transport complex subunit 5-domain-containing protein [Collybia nuda]|uniref:Conserved oligomeric Golgi complex subunit 5 n=1 Tax=Collybia nuda TaxID=64659 RepID=A0A9P6CIE7_9AGAR|nr:Golgi transport complex subunit 5-domain-containing protein [Collybia nuda]